jgi:hypothetical protein
MNFWAFLWLKNVPRLGDGECLFTLRREIGNELFSEPKECALKTTAT